MSLPKTFFRVEWEAGYGFPDLEYREHAKRNFENAQNAADQIAALAWPEGHHVLTGVWRGDVVWKPVDVSELPEPRERVA